MEETEAGLPGNRFWRTQTATLWLGIAVALCGWAKAAGAELRLQAHLTQGNQGLVLSWFGSNALNYQLQSCSTFGAWTNASPILGGNNAFLFVTNPLAGQSRAFFRISRVAVITAAFDAVSGILTVVGDELDNEIVIGRNAAGNILVNNGAVTVSGGTPTVANTLLIQVFGGDGNDRVSFDEANGALPKGNLHGESGNDTLTGGSGADLLNGGAGDDTLFGKGGGDTLLGGDQNDTLAGGDGDDIVQMGAGDDRFIWNPGDDTDVIEGNDGVDTVEVNGGNGAESFTVTANGTRVRFDRINPAPFALDLGACENLVLNANGGDDTLSCTGNLAALIAITADGGPGDDTLLGSNGPDLLMGGEGNDFIDGNQGNDVALLGPGNDTFQWDPGDGSDTIEGQADMDALVVNGSAGNETAQISPNGARVRFLRDLGNIALDVAGVERVDFRAAGGADTVIVSDLSATEVTQVNLDLALPGGAVGDALTDSIVLDGSPFSNRITLAQTDTNVTVVGLKATLTLTGGETNDLLRIQGLGGDDVIDGSGLSSLFTLTLDGGAGHDTLSGSPRADLLLGGDDADVLSGRQGNDLILAGAGDDTLVWNPGDGSDVMEGQAGSDTLVFNGSNASETLDISANGSRLRLFRNVANIVLDCAGLDTLEIHALGGADLITLNEVTGTEVTNITVDLAPVGGGGDAATDSVVVNGRQTNDAISLSSAPGTATLTGLPASITVAGADPDLDDLVVNALGGDDTVDASNLAAGVLRLTLNGGLGLDTLIGSQGDDLITGGDGNDLIFGGSGNDTVVWNPGDDNDTIEGQAGSDTLQFNGANVAENLDLSANGSRLRFFRNIASVVLDCAGIERVAVQALGGADVIAVNDLSATGVTAVHIDLASLAGGNVGDAQLDSLFVHGTATNNTILVTGSPGFVAVSGLSATITVNAPEAANDRLTLNLLAGDDVLDASGLLAGVIGLTGDGGADDDILIGSGGADTLLGGDGDDVLSGGPGLDVLDGGAGNNVIIQD